MHVSQQIHLTPRESERLRQVSYERQIEAGMSHPGSAGLTAERLGDANPFVSHDKANEDTGPACYTGSLQGDGGVVGDHSNGKAPEH